MDARGVSDTEQAELWNGVAGQAWVESQAMLDRLFRPIEESLAKAVVERVPARLLDVGCGTGSTTIAAARRLEGQGTSVGIDISEPMIAAACARAEREGVAAEFICADAESHAFEPGRFDMIISRFGVMFFADPVRAFANLRRASAPAAELRVAAWRSAAENPFMTTAERAAAALLPGLPARQAEGPGQFAFGDRDRVAGMLRESGWEGIEIGPLDVACTMPEAELVPYLTKLGPVGRALEGADPRTRAAAIEAARIAFAPYVRGAEVRFTAACWMIGARAPAAS